MDDISVWISVLYEVRKSSCAVSGLINVANTSPLSPSITQAPPDNRPLRDPSLHIIIGFSSIIC